MAWVEQEGAGIWLPKEKGDELTGEVVGVDDGLYGKQYVIKNDKEELKTPSHKVLQGRLVNVKIGDRVKLVYSGESAPAVRGQNPTKIYKVYIEKPDLKGDVVE